VHARTRLVLPALVLASSLLAACGGGTGTDSASSSGSPTGGSTSTGSPIGADGGQDGTAGGGSGEAPSFPANAEPDMADASADARTTVRNIRIGGHDGFDRVVFEVGGTGTPGWDVRYVEQASSQGSGAPIDVAGDAILQVTLTGVGYPYDTGVDEYAGPDPLAASGTEAVTEVAFDGTFEGTTVAFVGTSGQRPFRVYSLQDPARVVLEVAHTG
jgi:hypothetical protein